MLDINSTYGFLFKLRYLMYDRSVQILVTFIPSLLVGAKLYLNCIRQVRARHLRR